MKKNRALKRRSRRNVLAAAAAFLTTRSSHARSTVATADAADAGAAPPSPRSRRDQRPPRRGSRREDDTRLRETPDDWGRSLQRRPQQGDTSSNRFGESSVPVPLFGAGKLADWGGSPSSSGYEASPVPIVIDLNEGRENDGDDPVLSLTSAAAGDLHSVVLSSDGRVWTAGTVTDEGRGLGRDISGDGEGNDHGFAPVTEVYYQYISNPSSTLPLFVAAAASQFFTVLLDVNGRAWSTGANYDGRLCLGDFDSRDRFVQIPDVGGAIRAVAAGDRHTLLLREDGRVFACGWNAFGQLGINSIEGDVADPTEVPIIVTGEGGSGEDGEEEEVVVVAIAGGKGTSYFLAANGSALASGTNHDGQLCVGDRTNRASPALVGRFGDSVSSIAAGRSSLYLLMDDGSVMACGENSRGQLGDGTFDDSDVPVLVAGFGPSGGTAGGLPVAGLRSGPTASNAFFLAVDGGVYGVGSNGSGQLGVGDFDDRGTPKLVACADPSSDGARDVSSGNDHVLFLGEDASYCRGSPTASPHPSSSPTDTTGPTASDRPSVIPSVTVAPSGSPAPSYPPTETAAPTNDSTLEPTLEPTASPTLSPTLQPTIEVSTLIPTFGPTKKAAPVRGLPLLTKQPSSGRRRFSGSGVRWWLPRLLDLRSCATVAAVVIPWFLTTW